MTKKRKFSLDEIVSIRHIGRKKCYDLTIPKNHNFFANGILVHNTGFLEEHADCCILLHWPHFYDQTKPENNYKVIIAKQRNGRTGAHMLCYKPQFYKFYEMEQERTEIT